MNRYIIEVYNRSSDDDWEFNIIKQSGNDGFWYEIDGGTADGAESLDDLLFNLENSLIKSNKDQIVAVILREV